MRLLFALSLVWILIAPAAADETVFPAEVALPLSHKLSFTSALNGKSYTLFVQVPSFAPPPPNGYPVLYVLDGDQYFGTASEMNLSMGGKLVIVAISYGLVNNPAAVKKALGRATDDPAPVTTADMGRANSILRGDDMTLPVAPENDAPEFQRPARVGGLDTFLRIIETEVKPKIAALTKIDSDRQALYGHSLGGLAVLRALFTEPKAFQSFITSSPTIWWDGKAVLKDEAAFANSVTAGTIAPRVLITVGGREEPRDPKAITPDVRKYLDSLTPDRRAAVIAYKTNKLDVWGGMVTNARDLGKRLKRTKGGPGYKAEFILFPDQEHQSVAYDALNRAIGFVQ
jgi:predicted alpha/beta superfamily hydrolase